MRVRFHTDRDDICPSQNVASVGRRARALHAVQVLADRHARMVALVHGRATRRRREQRTARRGVARVRGLGSCCRRPRVGPRLELVQPALWPWLAHVWARQLLVVVASARRAWACLSCRIHRVESGQGRATCLDSGSGSSRSCTGHAWRSPAFAPRVQQPAAPARRARACQRRRRRRRARSARARAARAGAAQTWRPPARAARRRPRAPAAAPRPATGGRSSARAAPGRGSSDGVRYRVGKPLHRVLPQVVAAVYALLLVTAESAGF